MTLHEARHTLEAANPRDAAIRQAIKVVLTALPDDPEPYRPEVLKRADGILAAIARERNGFNPFQERTRLRKITVWRYAVWHQLRLEGYSCTQIGRATGYDHSTVYWGDRRITDWLSVHDFETMRVWRTLQEIIDKPEPQACEKDFIDMVSKEQPDFPTTDEQMEEFLATHPKIKVPEKYKNPDWLLKKQEQRPQLVDGTTSM